MSIEDKVKYIRHAVIDQGMRMNQLAEKLGVSKTYLSTAIGSAKQNEFLDKAIAILKEGNG